MQKLKRTLNVRVKDKVQMIELMKKLGEFDMDLIAESRLGLVKIVVNAPKEEVRELERKIGELIGGRNPHKTNVDS